MDTCKGGVSCNMEKDFVDEKEEADKEEENAQQASGESVLRCSQNWGAFAASTATGKVCSRVWGWSGNPPGTSP
ncbi:hypothetical protein UY3_03113 [Chelonia mydas]|uniref:Uncharacterized protein n=1 Tax=Chelonia mydas TaxID=8469 RepID=M7BQZ7_CHEMY|nr:hypothetical protein UY3_03113 [Chelonia mydas]